MEKPVKPENLFIGRKRWLTAIAAFICFAFGLTLVILTPIAVKLHPPEDGQAKVMLIAGTAVIGALCIFYGILNFRNLFFPYLLTADEKGVYNYSGLFHYGFIGWEDIENFTKDPTILDLLDSDQPCLKIYLKDFKAYKTGLSLYRKAMLFFGGCGIKIYTMCSQIKRKELFRLLSDMNSYYNTPEPTVDFNER